jgi:hypothetical protein
MLGDDWPPFSPLTLEWNAEMVVEESVHFVPGEPRAKNEWRYQRGSDTTALPTVPLWYRFTIRSIASFTCKSNSPTALAMTTDSRTTNIA